MKEKCAMCGGAMTSHRENQKFESLPGVTLQSVEVLRCKECGEREIVIPHLDALVRALATFVVEKKAKLTGAEIRFLRKSLGWSGADFAEHVGVGRDTVSKWENDKEAIGPQSDRLLRMMVVHATPLDDYSLDGLVGLDATAKPVRIKAKQKSAGWEATAA